MNSLDLLVLSGLVAFLGFPVIAKWFRSMYEGLARPKPAPADRDPSPEEWRQKWTGLLLSLMDDIDCEIAGPMPHAMLLAKELVWEIIGGDEKPKKAGGGK
jgi:hypothetical protein